MYSFSIPSGQGTPPFGHAARRGEGERKGPSISRHTRLIAGGGPDGAEWDGMRRVVDGERAYGEIARRQNDDGTAETVGSLSLRSFMSRVSMWRELEEINRVTWDPSERREREMNPQKPPNFH